MILCLTTNSDGNFSTKYTEQVRRNKTGTYGTVAHGGAVQGAGGLLQGSGHDLGRQGEVLAKVIDTLVGQVPIEVGPGVTLSHQIAGLEALHELDDLQHE
eukprot:1188950-Prorocentrum_minimum.AAC.3